MPTTTNNGWITPADTDLVKNGASAIRTLGNAIDTTLGVYASPGLVKISGTTFSAASSVSLPNNSFTATYKNYRLIAYGTASSTSRVDMNFRFRASGSDNTNSSYFRWLYERTNAAAGNDYQSTTASKIGYAGNIFWLFTSDIINPFDSNYNSGFTAFASTLSNSDNIAGWLNGQFNGTTSFDSCSFYPASGTITGEYVVYGYKA